MQTFRSSSKRGKFIRLSVLIVGLILPFFFIIFGLPFLSQAFGAAHLHQVIIDEGIDAGAWFWSQMENFHEIIPRMRHQIQFSPARTPSTDTEENSYYPGQYVLE